MRRASLALVALAGAAVVAPAFTTAAYAQVPSPAEGGRVQERLKQPLVPRSEAEPLIPQPQDQMAPEDAAKVRFVLKGVAIEGSTVYSEADLLELYQNMLNTEVSLADLFDVANAISARYRADGYILSRAVVPAQRVVGGIVRIQVVEGFIDKITVEGYRFDSIFGRRLIEAYGERIRRSRPLKAADLERYLLLMDDLPGITAEGVLTPSLEVTGASDLTVVIDHALIQGYGTYDNRGSRFIGPSLFQGLAAFNSALGLNEQTVARIAVTKHTSELQFLELTHEQIVTTEGTKVRVDFSNSFAKPAYTIGDLDIKSRNIKAGIRVQHPLIRSRAENLTVETSFDWRNLHTKNFAGTIADDRLRVFRVGGTYDFVDTWEGVNLFNVVGSHGVDWFGARDEPSPFLSRADGKADFTKFNFLAQRLQGLPWGFSLFGAITGQYSLNGLLSSEEFGVGGAEFGRGFAPSEVTGEHGFATKLELRYSRTLDWSLAGIKVLNDFTLYMFYDHASVWNNNREQEGADGYRADLDSWGGGVRVNFNENLSMEVEVADPLNRSLSDRGEAPRLLMSVTGRF